MTVNYDHEFLAFCVSWTVGLAGRRPDARDLSAHGVG